MLNPPCRPSRLQRFFVEMPLFHEKQHNSGAESMTSTRHEYQPSAPAPGKPAAALPAENVVSNKQTVVAFANPIAVDITARHRVLIR